MAIEEAKDLVLYIFYNEVFLLYLLLILKSRCKADRFGLFLDPETTDLVFWMLSIPSSDLQLDAVSVQRHTCSDIGTLEGQHICAGPTEPQWLLSTLSFFGFLLHAEPSVPPVEGPLLPFKMSPTPLISSKEILPFLRAFTCPDQHWTASWNPQHPSGLLAGSHTGSIRRNGEASWSPFSWTTRSRTSPKPSRRLKLVCLALVLG